VACGRAGANRSHPEGDGHAENDPQAIGIRHMTTEKRKFPRRHIDLSAEIEMVDGSSLRCDLSDLSQGGVRLRVPHPDNLPEQFLLKLSSRLRRWSRIAWRTAEEVGVEFLAAPQAPADEAARRSVVIQCPKTAKSIPTGIRLTSAADLDKLSPVRRFTQCAHCKAVHGWLPADACLEPVPRPAQAPSDEAARPA
jgi:PilZ domain